MGDHAYEFPQRASYVLFPPGSNEDYLIPLLDTYSLRNPYARKPLVVESLSRSISSKCPPETHDYLLLLRDPVERVWSLYEDERKASRLRGEIRFQCINEYLSRLPQVNNELTRMLAGLNVGTSKIPTLADYKKALHNLKLIKHVLVMDNPFTAISRFLDDHYNIPILASDMPHVPTERRYGRQTLKPIDSLDAELIRQHNLFDVQLYEHVLHATSAPT